MRRLLDRIPYRRHAAGYKKSRKLQMHQLVCLPGCTADEARSLFVAALARSRQERSDVSEDDEESDEEDDDDRSESSDSSDEGEVARANRWPLARGVRARRMGGGETGRVCVCVPGGRLTGVFLRAQRNTRPKAEGFEPVMMIRVRLLHEYLFQFPVRLWVPAWSDPMLHRGARD